LSLEKQKKTIIPNVENKVFRKTEKVFRLYFEKTVLFIQNSEDLFSQLDKQFDRAEEAFEKLSRTSNTARSIILNQKTFIKSLRFFDSGIKR
jgi:transcription-repair coupling factor (superfamily II helicase)